MRALRGKPTARAWKGDHGRRSAAASGDRSAPGEGPHHRVPVPERGLWTLRKGYPCTIAGGDRRTVWAAIDGADRVLDGRLPANHLSTVLVSLAVGASAAAVQHGARSSLPPKDTIALIVSISAVVLSILFFFLNRRYTRAVFEATNYPDLKFQTFCGTVYQLRREPVWCWLADTTGQPLWETCLFVRWSNPTKTDAVNVRATITLAQGMRRIRWEEAGDDWRLLKAGSEGSAAIFPEPN